MEDVTTEILLRLPLKSLMRCKCLSKGWNDFISHNPSFISAYFPKSRASSPIMLGFFVRTPRAEIKVDKSWIDSDDEEDDHEDKTIQLSTKFLPTFPHGELASGSLPHDFDQTLGFLGTQEIFIVGSSNGFLLCSRGKFPPSNYCVCNPITKERIALPKPSYTNDSVATGFICHSSHYPCLSMVNYKVVRGSENSASHPGGLIVQIFSSETFQWKLLFVTCPSPFTLEVFGMPSVIISEEDDVIHWLAYTEPGNRRKRAVVMFDQRKSDLQLVAVPRPNFRSVDVECFGQSQGHISYARGHRSTLEIWVLDCEKRWSLKYNINLSLELMVLEILGFNPSNSLELFVATPTQEIATYNFSNSTVQMISRISGCDCYMVMYPYVWPNWPPFRP